MPYNIMLQYSYELIAVPDTRCVRTDVVPVVIILDYGSNYYFQ